MFPILHFNAAPLPFMVNECIMEPEDKQCLELLIDQLSATCEQLRQARQRLKLAHETLVLLEEAVKELEVRRNSTQCKIDSLTTWICDGDIHP